ERGETPENRDGSDQQNSERKPRPRPHVTRQSIRRSLNSDPSHPIQRSVAAACVVSPSDTLSITEPTNPKRRASTSHARFLLFSVWPRPEAVGSARTYMRPW